MKQFFFSLELKSNFSPKLAQPKFMTQTYWCFGYFHKFFESIWGDLLAIYQPKRDQKANDVYQGQRNVKENRVQPENCVIFFLLLFCFVILLSYYPRRCVRRWRRHVHSLCADCWIHDTCKLYVGGINVKFKMMGLNLICTHTTHPIYLHPFILSSLFCAQIFTTTTAASAQQQNKKMR